MRIIETFIQGKEKNSQTCEDGILVSEDLVAVIDGVTTSGDCIWDGYKSGYFAKEILLRALREIADSGSVRVLDGDALLERLDAALRDEVHKRRSGHISAEEYPRASVIIYNNLTNEVISYGDCQCMVGGVVHAPVKKIDELNADLRAYYLEYHLRNGMSLQELAEKDPGRRAILESLQMQSIFENKPGAFGYAVLNGRGIERSMIERYKVNQGEEVILASDGYPRLARSLEESEMLLKQILQEDPMCFRKYRATKGMEIGNISFDDRAFCRLIV